MIAGNRHSTTRPIGDTAAALRSVRRRLILCCLTLWLWLPANGAEAGQIVDILLSDNARHYEQVADALVTGIRQLDPSHQVNLHYASATKDWPTPHRDALLVTIGSVASADAIRRFPAQRQLSLFLTEEFWNSLAKPGGPAPKAAIFIDQPLERLLVLGKALAPQATTYAAVLGPVSSKHQARLEQFATTLDARFISEAITADSNPLTLLTPLMRSADLFIALPENNTLNRNLAKWVLHLAFKHKRPVIGFSKAYTDAGGTASLYTDNEDISRQALEWLDSYLADPQQAQWQTDSPRYFTISINPSVVRILKLNNADEQTLHRQVQRLLDTTQP